MQKVPGVDDVDVDDAHAGEPLDLGLHPVRFLVGQVEPGEAFVGQPLVGRDRRDVLARLELPEVHPRPWGRPPSPPERRQRREQEYCGFGGGRNDGAIPRQQRLWISSM